MERAALVPLALAGVLACAGHGAIAVRDKTADRPSPAAAASTPTDFPVRVPNADGSVIAWFSGEKPPEDPKAPLVYGVSALAFEFAGDAKRYPFTPRGELFFSDWSFDVFSPDGKWALLLQDRFGPYHVVRTRNLRTYLEHTAPPDKVEHTIVPSGLAALVHSNARWVSDTEFEYQVGGETQGTVRAKVNWIGTRVNRFLR